MNRKLTNAYLAVQNLVRALEGWYEPKATIDPNTLDDTDLALWASITELMMAQWGDEGLPTEVSPGFHERMMAQVAAAMPTLAEKLVRIPA